jgi:DNA-binding LacI/PurR family transcriptional regulator
MKPNQPHGSATQQHIAELCGVSQVTVSKALRNDAKISQEMRDRIQQVAKELKYDPAVHTNARQLILRRFGQQLINRIIALFCSADFQATPYYSRLNQGITSGLMNKGFGVLACNYKGDTLDQIFGPYQDFFSRCNVDGMLIVHTQAIFPTLVDQLRHNPGFVNRPILTLVPDIPGCSTVTADEERGAYLATKHLLELGHRYFLQFYFVPVEEGIHQPESHIQGVRRALVEFRLDPQRHLYLFPYYSVWHVPIMLLDERGFGGRNNESVAKTALIEFITAHPEITAILALNDTYAIHLWYALRENGFRVPEDYSLVGFDDTDPLFDADGHNRLTSVNVPLQEIGCCAASTLAAQITEQNWEPQHIKLPTTLVVRGTTAPPGRVLDPST